MTHCCENCDAELDDDNAPSRIETITACPKGGTCTYVRIETAE